MRRCPERNRARWLTLAVKGKVYRRVKCILIDCISWLGEPQNKTNANRPPFRSEVGHSLAPEEKQPFKKLRLNPKTSTLTNWLK